MKIEYTEKQLKIIIKLMLINCFALFVNYFGFMGVLNVSNRGLKQNYIYAFTSSTGDLGGKGFSDSQSYYNTVTGSYIYQTFNDNKSDFYPFVSFIDNDTYNCGIDMNKTCYVRVFKGIFPYYDFSEFFVYTLLIFGLPILINFYKQKDT